MSHWLRVSLVAVLFVAAAFLATSAQAQVAADEMFLPHPDLVREALDQHPDVLYAGAMLRSANAKAAARRVGPHEITLNGEYVSRDTRLDGRFDEWTAGVSRAFRLPGKRSADTRIGDLGIDVADNGYEDSRHEAALDLKSMWMAWLAAEKDFTIAGEVVETHEQRLSATERLLELGEAAMLEVEQVRSALAQMRIQEALANRARQEAKVTLQHNFPNLVLPMMVPELPQPGDVPRATGSWDEWRMAVVDNSHEALMAQSEADRWQWLARRARLDQFADPTMGLRAFGERSGEESGLGVFFSIPIGGRYRRAESESLSAQAMAVQFEARKILRDVELVAEHDILQVELGLEAWQQSFEALQASSQALARMNRSVEVGESGLTELLIAQRQDFEVRRIEALARNEAHAAVLKLQIDSHSIWGLGDD